MTRPRQKPSSHDQIMARIAARISSAYLTPIDPEAPNLLRMLADIFRQRAQAGWTTRLSPETTMLVAEALEAYTPKPPPPPPSRSPDHYFHIDLYASGSTIYRLGHDGEVREIAAWAQSTTVARSAFDKLVEQYPRDRFIQKRKSWVEAP